ncbi:aldo-keto reductase AKR2E4-like isoform X2 [Ostrinia furnacalis]|uniref:aldo-keto reductase AKR2E4-like isoform X2 n=1 Tax=Ostrinia furnacalis TaxID=93504 RepID=UPI00103E6541|nr:aldo-keto reductase AKR2E4-like isoform X2 [Ostrinia furnacalis]
MCFGDNEVLRRIRGYFGFGRNRSSADSTMVVGVEVPKLKMNDGNYMPAIALGTYLGFGKDGPIKSENNMLHDAIIHALNAGYRHIDTAAIYNTEAEIGEALRMKLASGEIKREDLFITTKLWNTDHKREEVMEAMKESLTKLGLSYVDLYLMHWPMGLNDYSHSDTDYIETWRGMEDVQRLGLAKSIGVSNFNKEQLTRLLREAEIKPTALQIEVHPQIIQTELVQFAHSEGIVVMGYSPFGALVMRYGMELPGPRFTDLRLADVAKKYRKTPAQVALRWLVDRNIVPIPKSVNPKRLEENINIFDFKLAPEEINRINDYNSNTRYTLPSFWQDHPYYPFEKIASPAANPFLRD